MRADVLAQVLRDIVAWALEAPDSVTLDRLTMPAPDVRIIAKGDDGLTSASVFTGRAMIYRYCWQDEAA